MYTLTLDEGAMQDLARAIAPEVEKQAVTFTDGSMEATVEDGALTNVRIRCAGSLQIVLTQTQVSLGAELKTADRTVSIPEPVMQALKQ